MKISNSIGSSVAVESTQVQTSRMASTSAANATGKADSTTLSATSLRMQENNGTDVRYEKVASLKAAIDAGTYSVPASAVADSIIKSMFA